MRISWSATLLVAVVRLSRLDVSCGEYIVDWMSFKAHQERNDHFGIIDRISYEERRIDSFEYANYFDCTIP